MRLFAREEVTWKEVEDQVMEIIKELNKRHTTLTEQIAALEEKVKKLESEPRVVNNYHYNQPQPVFTPPQPITTPYPNPYPYTTWCKAGDTE